MEKIKEFYQYSDKIGISKKDANKLLELAFRESKIITFQQVIEKTGNNIKPILDEMDRMKESFYGHMARMKNRVSLHMEDIVNDVSDCAVDEYISSNVLCRQWNEFQHFGLIVLAQSGISAKKNWNEIVDGAKKKCEDEGFKFDE